MSALNIKAAHAAHAAAISLIENMEQAQEGLLEIGILESKDRAEIPAKPTLMKVGFAMAQKALNTIEHHNRNVSGSIGLEYELYSAFHDAGKAKESMSSDDGITMLSRILEITENLKNESSSLIEFLARKDISGVAACIMQDGSFEYDLARGANSITLSVIDSKSVIADRIYNVMQLSDTTNGTTKAEIEEALVSGEYKGELFTVKTLKAGVKFQLTKCATDAIKATINNIKHVYAELEGMCNRAQKEIKEAMHVATQGALTNVEHTAQIEQAFRARLEAKRQSKAA